MTRGFVIEIEMTRNFETPEVTGTHFILTFRAIPNFPDNVPKPPQNFVEFMPARKLLIFEQLFLFQSLLHCSTLKKECIVFDHKTKQKFTIYENNNRCS